MLVRVSLVAMAVGAVWLLWRISPSASEEEARTAPAPATGKNKGTSNPARKTALSKQERPLAQPIDPGSLLAEHLGARIQNAKTAAEKAQSKQDIPAVTLSDLLTLNPLVAVRIQEGLASENLGALTPCFEMLRAPEKNSEDQPHVVDFDLVLDLHIEEEVGTIRSAEVQERLQPLPDASRKCFSEQLAGMTFDGADIAFEGPVIYPMRAIAR